MVQVRNIEHRQKREMVEEEQRRARQAEMDAAEREQAAKIRLEQEAFQQQLQVCTSMLYKCTLWCACKQI